MPVRNRPQRLTSVFFKRLKNLKELSIDFNDKPITAIFGANGSGKSTIIHALACIYKPTKKSSRPNFRFSNFFLPTSLATWANSEFSIEYVMRDGDDWKSDSKEYKKGSSRWNPRYDNRVAREIFYIGIDTCLPDMERETRQSRIQLLPSDYHDAGLAKSILDAMSVIMDRPYEEIKLYNDSKYRGLKFKGIAYSSLYMGAGEQRLLRILQTVLSAPDYSLILIDELDLTIHTFALNRLIAKLNQFCLEKHLQIVFTTHREELLSNNLISVRHLVSSPNGYTSSCLNHTTPECVRRLTGVSPKPIEIIVEDDLAEALVRRLARIKHIEQHCHFMLMGSYQNAYPLGAGLILKDDDIANTLFVLDGDEDRTDAEKIKGINKVFTGSDALAVGRRDKLKSMIRQFNLPRDSKPEVYIKDLLCGIEDNGSILISKIKTVGIQEDHHDYLNIPIADSGLPKSVALNEITERLSELPEWNNYISEISDWLDQRILAMNLN